MRQRKKKQEESENKNSMMYYLRGVKGFHGKNCNFEKPNSIIESAIVAICIRKNEDGIFSRGIAICSIMEPFNKKEGRKLAAKRAIIADKSKRSSMPMDSNNVAWALGGLYQIEYDKFTEIYPIHSSGKVCKSNYNIVLTPYEQRIVTAATGKKFTGEKFNG